ncbi:HNH endonuclease [Halorussus sp. MSC15.2]|nr:HNH endonuclease [Halorussus sp. MSC15.2]
MEEHHILPRRYDGSDEPENLVTLCSNCHTAIEKIYGDDFFDRLIENIKNREFGGDVTEGVECFAEEYLGEDNVSVPKGTTDGSRAEIFRAYKDFCERRRFPRHTVRRRFLRELESVMDGEFWRTV